MVMSQHSASGTFGADCWGVEAEISGKCKTPLGWWPRCINWVKDKSCRRGLAWGAEPIARVRADAATDSALVANDTAAGLLLVVPADYNEVVCLGD